MNLLRSCQFDACNGIVFINMMNNDKFCNYFPHFHFKIFAKETVLTID